MTAEPTTRVLKAETDAIAAAAGALRAGGLVAFPTETVYGLGADAGNGETIARLYAAKGRPAFNPLIAHVADAAAGSTASQCACRRIRWRRRYSRLLMGLWWRPRPTAPVTSRPPAPRMC